MWPGEEDFWLIQICNGVSLQIMSVEDFFAGRRVVVTGGLGFIGSNLAHRLVSCGCKVVLVDSLIPEYGGNIFNIQEISNQVRVNISDIRDRNALPRLIENVDVVFNLAGQTSHLDSMLDPFTDLDVNAKSQLSLLETCRRYNPEARVVFASTRQIYGRPDYLPVDERHPIRPVDVNGINKAAGEQYHMLYHEVHGLKTCALRLTNTYGPRMRVRDARQTFLGIWIRQAIEKSTIRVFGDGTQLRDFTYVDDCVEALMLAGKSTAAVGEVFNVGGSEVIDLVKVAEMLVSLVPGAHFEVVPFPSERKAIDIGDYFANDQKIRLALGWEPRISLMDGLAKTVRYYEEHSEMYWGQG